MNAPQEIRAIILELLKQKHVSANKMLTDCKYNASLVNDLKKGQMPSADKIANIANYLEVSIDFLLGNSPANAQNAESGSLRNSDEDFMRELRAVFYGSETQSLIEEDKRRIIDMAKIISTAKAESVSKKHAYKKRGS
jgi:transcriptional regulator with XRE-family HTH domain